MVVNNPVLVESFQRLGYFTDEPKQICRVYDFQVDVPQLAPNFLVNDVETVLDVEVILHSTHVILFLVHVLLVKEQLHHNFPEQMLAS